MKTKTTVRRAAVDTVATPALLAGRAMRYVLAIAAVVAAVSAAALASPSPASAATDSLHQHGWTFGSGAQCWNNSWDPYAQASFHIDMKWPDLVTSPVKIVNGVAYSQKVYLLAELQYYDFGVRDWRTVGGAPYSPWYYTSADNYRMIGWWYENGTNRYAPNSFSFPVTGGDVYRIKVWYYWGVDGASRFDTTNYCDFR